MDFFQTKTFLVSGSNYKEINKNVKISFKKIASKTKRKPYLRSAYFNKEKIFFDYFWIHIRQKREIDRVRRLRFFDCMVELILNSKLHPFTIQNPSKKSEVLHRFYGKSKDGESFVIQIKEHKPTGNKNLLSIFPLRK